MARRALLTCTRIPDSGAFDSQMLRSADYTGRIVSSAAAEEASIMTYQFTQAAEAMAVAEREHAKAAAIRD